MSRRVPGISLLCADLNLILGRLQGRIVARKLNPDTAEGHYPRRVEAEHLFVVLIERVLNPAEKLQALIDVILGGNAQQHKIVERRAILDKGEGVGRDEDDVLHLAVIDGADIEQALATGVAQRRVD